MKGRQEHVRDLSNSNPQPDRELGDRPSLPSLRAIIPEFTQSTTNSGGGVPRPDYPQFPSGQEQHHAGFSSYPSQQHFYGHDQPTQHLPPLPAAPGSHAHAHAHAHSSQYLPPPPLGGSGSGSGSSRGPAGEGGRVPYAYPGAYLPSMPPGPPGPGGLMARNANGAPSPPNILPPPGGHHAAPGHYSPYDSHGPRSPSSPFSTSTIPGSASSSLAPIHAPLHPHPQRDGPMFIRLGTTANGSLEVNARSDNPRGLSSVSSTWIEAKEPATTGGARHVCEICHRTFDRPSTLKTHMNAHTGSKPYLCSKCGRGFGASSNMRRHERSCRETGPPPQSPNSSTST